MPSRGALAQRPLGVDPAGPLPAVFLRSSSLPPLFYRKRIDALRSARPGDLVAVYGPDDALLGYGLYNPRSEIAVRMLFPGEELPDEARWQQKLDSAVLAAPRPAAARRPTDAYRLVHAEADGLPGWSSTAMATCSRPRCSAWACTSGPRRS